MTLRPVARRVCPLVCRDRPTVLSLSPTRPARASLAFFRRLKKYGCDDSDAALDKMIRYIDVDGDGQVSLQEFAAVHAVQPINQDQQL